MTAREGTKKSSSTRRKDPAPLRYAVVIEKADGNFSAYVPDLPGCVATGSTRGVTLKRIAGAVEMHLAGLREDGQRIPRPTARAEYIDAVA